jgi:Tfp pilus assembly protein PilF
LTPLPNEQQFQSLGTVDLPTPEQRQAAARQYLNAMRWLAAQRTANAVALLLNCCRLDPASMVYRQALRKTQRLLSASRGPFGLLKRWRATRALQNAVQSQHWQKVLDLAEKVLTLDPANEAAHLGMATAFESLEMPEHAVWTLEQACVDKPPSDSVSRELTRLYERTGSFSRAQQLANPTLQPAQEPASNWQAQRQGELDAFRQDLILAERKLAADPEDHDLRNAAALLRREIQAREIEICRQQADRHPGDTSLTLNLGAMLLKAGQFEAALDTLKAARSDERNAWRATLYSAYCHLNMSQRRMAELLLREALLLMPPEENDARKEVLLLLASGTPQGPSPRESRP